MNVDFLHNQIIRDTISQRFIESFNENLVPYLISEYGSALEEVQFYEDHLASGLRINGEFFYPLTLVCNGRCFTRWVKWQVSNYRNYDKFNPFTYKGAELLEFTLLDEVPDTVAAVVAGRPIYSDSAAIPLLITSVAEDKTFLAGKYSQGFVDALAHAITEKIEKEFSISGLAESGAVLEIRFEPSTFMEHIVGNTTYRRLLIKARGCAARDLWVKWTRLDGKGVYTVSDNVLEDDIVFDLAEDVSGKIKEKEYRYLTAESVEKYQSAMGRKNITAWRDSVRRMIRRGEVILLEKAEDDELIITEEPLEELPEEIPEEIPEVSEQLPEEIIEEPITVSPDIESDPFDALFADLDDEPIEEDEEDDDLKALIRSAIGVSATVKEEVAEGISEEPEDEIEEIEERLEDEIEDIEDELEDVEDDIEDIEEELEEIDEEIEDIEEELEESDDESEEDAASISEAEMRLEIERQVRAEMAEELRRKEKEAEELRARLDAKIRAEEREKELLAEAARAAVAEREREAQERLEAEEREREENERREAERRRIEEEERKAREAAAEEARIKAELEAKERARAEAEEARIAAERASAEEIKYVSKVVKLLFRRPIDPSITKRIHEIIVATIKYYHKEDVYIKIKAVIPDATTVNLEFVKIPEAEIPLLVNIIKVLGRSDLGITKAILD